MNRIRLPHRITIKLFYIRTCVHDQNQKATLIKFISDRYRTRFAFAKCCSKPRAIHTRRIIRPSVNKWTRSKMRYHIHCVISYSTKPQFDNRVESHNERREFFCRKGISAVKRLGSFLRRGAIRSRLLKENFVLMKVRSFRHAYLPLSDLLSKSRGA